MARRVTLSQLKSNVRQAIDKYNREVNTYNARVRADRQRLRNELARLGRQAATARFVTFRTSFNVVLPAYERLEQAAIGSRFDARHNEILDLAERETANNAGLLNAILGDSEPASQAPANPSDSPLTPILHAISVDFSDRWRGALFSLNLLNPDAARHFCSSAREIIAGILDTKAPDAVVAADDLDVLLDGLEKRVGGFDGNHLGFAVVNQPLGLISRLAPSRPVSCEPTRWRTINCLAQCVVPFR